jgi:hypothetical protein
MTQPIVSVLMPAFNRQAFVGEAIRSIIAQSLQGWELIVVDDGSTDRTADVVSTFTDARIRLVRLDANLGIPSARNRALEEARGRYVAWLDSDDVARRRRLELQVAWLGANPDVAMIGGCAGKIMEDGRRKTGIRVPPFNYEEIRCRELFTSAFQQSSLMGRAEILKAHRYHPELQVCEDIDVCVRIGNAHPVANLPRVLVDRRLHGEQVTKASKQTIFAAQAKISKPQLDEMGMTYSGEDLERHCALARVPLEPPTDHDLQWAEQWLTRLLGANANSARFCQSALRSLAAQLLFDRYRRRSIRSLGGALLRSPFTPDLLSRRSGSWLMAALAAVVSGSRT